MGDTLQISGLKEFNKALKSVDKSAPKMTREALNECADFLIGKTRPLIPKRTGAAAGSLKKRSTRTDIRISVGGNRAPYYPWLDFGGRVGRKKRVVRTFISEGRYLYPTLRKNREQFAQIGANALRNVARQAGLDVS